MATSLFNGLFLENCDVIPAWGNQNQAGGAQGGVAGGGGVNMSLYEGCLVYYNKILGSTTDYPTLTFSQSTTAAAGTTKVLTVSRTWYKLFASANIANINATNQVGQGLWIQNFLATPVSTFVTNSLNGTAGGTAVASDVNMYTLAVDAENRRTWTRPTDTSISTSPETSTVWAAVASRPARMIAYGSKFGGILPQNPII